MGVDFANTFQRTSSLEIRYLFSYSNVVRPSAILVSSFSLSLSIFCSIFRSNWLALSLVIVYFIASFEISFFFLYLVRCTFLSRSSLLKFLRQNLFSISHHTEYRLHLFLVLFFSSFFPLLRCPFFLLFEARASHPCPFREPSTLVAESLRTQT